MEKKLGRGLSSLLDAQEELSVAPVPESIIVGGIEVNIMDIIPSPGQPRSRFDTSGLQGLADSIKANGIIQPLIVRKNGKKYEIIAGERRWRAAQLAGLRTIPVVVRDALDQEIFRLALLENIQRADLNPIEEAEGYRRLIQEEGFTQEEVSAVLGKSRPHVTNLLRLLTLPESVRKFVEEGSLSAGHARALAGAEDPEALAWEVIGNRLNVRQTESLVARANRGSKSSAAPSSTSSVRMEIKPQPEFISIVLGERRVEAKVYLFSEGQGELVIPFERIDELDAVLEQLTPSRTKNPIS